MIGPKTERLPDECQLVCYPLDLVIELWNRVKGMA